MDNITLVVRTPLAVNITDRHGNIIVLLPEERVFSMDEETVLGGYMNEFPVWIKRFGRVMETDVNGQNPTALPPQQEGVFYVVGERVARHITGRDDILTTRVTGRDQHGIPTAWELQTINAPTTLLLECLTWQINNRNTLQENL